MLNSSMITKHRTESSTRILPKVYARFNLNRYPEYIVTKDADRALTKASGKVDIQDHGKMQYGETRHIVKPFRYGHGVTFPIVLTNDSPFYVYDGKDARFDRVVPIIPSEYNAYLYYVSSGTSGKTKDSMGYTLPYIRNANDNALSNVSIEYCYPRLSDEDPYFVLQEKEFALANDDGSLPQELTKPLGMGDIDTAPVYIHGNAIDFRFNTVLSSPRNFKVDIAYKDYGSQGVRKTATIYDSSVHGPISMSSGTIYRVKSVERINGNAVLSLYQDVNPASADSAPVTVTGPLDIINGEELAIRNVHPSVDGIYKVIAVDDANKRVTIDCPGPESLFVIDNLNVRSTQAYSADPGKFTLFLPNNWNGVAPWTTEKSYWEEGSTNLIAFSRVQLRVYSVSRPDAPVEIIEIAPSLYANFTKQLINFNISVDSGASDPTFPVGESTASLGTLSLSNTQGTFDANNYLRLNDKGSVIGSPIANLMTDKVEFVIDAEQSSLTDGTTKTVRLATMISSDTWRSESREATQVQLTDYAKILMERDAPDLLLRSQDWQNDRAMYGKDKKKDIYSRFKDSFGTTAGYSVSGIIMNVLAAAGWRRVLPWHESVYYLSDKLNVNEPRLRFFWCRKESSVWDVIQDVAKSTQTAVFFDRYGYLRILPRDMATEYRRGVEGMNSWRLMAKKRGGIYPDIVSVARVKSTSINKVRVNYTSVATTNEERAANAVFWSPPENLALHVAEISGSVKAGTTRLKIKPRAGLMFDYSGYVVFANNAVRYQASAYWLTRGVAKGNGLWTKYWVKSREGWEQLKILNDGYPPVPGNELYIENGLSGSEEGVVIKKPVPDIDQYEANSGWKIRYIIDGIAGDAGNIDGTQWRSYDKQAESWILSCKEADFPKSIKLPKDSKATSNDQFLVAYRNYELDNMENIDRVIAKFKFTQGTLTNGANFAKNVSSAGITLYNAMSGKKEKFYALAVYLGDKKNGKGTEPKVTMYRITDNGNADDTDDKKEKNAIRADFVKNAGTSIDLHEWCILEVEVLKRKKNEGEFDYEFAVYLNGFNVARFVDDGARSLSPNTRAGFFVRNAVVELDSIAVVDEPRRVKPARNKKERETLKSAMKRTHRKRTKETVANRKGTAKNGRGNSAKKPRGKNKTRRKQ